MVKSVRTVASAVALSFRADRKRAWSVFTMLSIRALSGVLTAYWLKMIVDAASRRDTQEALVVALVIGVTAAVAQVSGSIGVQAMLPLTEHTGAYIDRRLIELTTGLAGLEQHERPDYINEMELLRVQRRVLATSGNQAAMALALMVRSVATAVLLASVHLLLLGVPVFALASLWAGRKAEDLHQRALDVAAEDMRQARHVFELATSAPAGKELRIFGLGPELNARYRSLYRGVDRTLDRAEAKGVLAISLGWIVFSVGYVGAIILVVQQAVLGRATIGDVVLALGLLTQVNTQVAQGVGTVNQMVETVKVAARYLWLLDYARKWTWKAEDPAPVPDRIVDGIEFKDVGFRYPGTEADVITGVNLTVPAGSIMAIVGDNGAGKSTLVKLLCRFYEPAEGVITVDGVDLRRIDVEAWRLRTSAAFQDFARLELVARETVGVGDLAFIDDEDVVRSALERAAASDVPAGLPRGLDSQVGRSFEDGTEPSGGQWQKLALARAMMRPRPLLLVLDEPTAALDAETEHDLFERYAAAARAAAGQTGAITVLVSHRFSTVRMADLIVVIDGGRVAEAGSHGALMANDGLYAELYELQARAYR